MTRDLFGELPPPSSPAARTAIKTTPAAPRQRPPPEPLPPGSLVAFEPSGALPKYSGRCRGGPTDGLMLYHGEPIFMVAERLGRRITYCGPPADGITLSWYHFVGGEWVLHSTEEPPRKEP